jgi:adenosylhomocysteine nucleosidase
LNAGVVAALAAEARTLGPTARRGDGLLATLDGTLVAVSGMGSEAAAVAAIALVDAGVTALVSWGLAGGLDPSLPAGTICLPAVVISRSAEADVGTESFGTDLHWREIVGAAIAARHVVGGLLLTHPVAIENVAAKAAAFRETGAAAVDMESAAVAAVAASRGLRFIAVRVIVDTASDALPAAVLAASGGGQIRIPRLLQGLLRHPGDIAPLLRLARRYRAATRGLVAVARTGTLAPLAFAAASTVRIA